MGEAYTMASLLIKKETPSCEDVGAVHLHSVAEVGPSGGSHHGQQARPRPDVQDHDLVATSLHSGHGCSDALVVFFILTTKQKVQF